MIDGSGGVLTAAGRAGTRSGSPTGHGWTVLVVDGEHETVEAASASLAGEGFRVQSARSGRAALDVVERRRPDLVVLGALLPDMTGEEVCASIRLGSDIPIIMLGPETRDDVVLRGLQLGADDYLRKPVSPRELAARARAVLRRARGSRMLAPAERLLVADGRVELALGTMRAMVDGRDPGLTPTEFRLLVALCRPPGRLRTRDELRSLARGAESQIVGRTIDAHVRNLRRKLDAASPGAARLVRSVYGEGYLFEP